MASLDQGGEIFAGKVRANDQNLALADRRGFATGATATGKTCRCNARRRIFARGAAAFGADGLPRRARGRPEFVNRAKGMGFDYAAEEFSDVFWDLAPEVTRSARRCSGMGPPMVSNGSKAAGNLGDAVVRGASGGVIRR